MNGATYNLEIVPKYAICVCVCVFVCLCMYVQGGQDPFGLKNGNCISLQLTGCFFWDIGHKIRVKLFTVTYVTTVNFIKSRFVYLLFKVCLRRSNLVNSLVYTIFMLVSSWGVSKLLVCADFKNGIHFAPSRLVLEISQN